MDRDAARRGHAAACHRRIDCRDTLLRSEAEGLELVGIGLEGIVAIAMPDAVLVADASRSQEVKLAVAALKAKGAKQAEAFPKDHRPWGWFETLVLADRFQVKRIVVHPGARAVACKATTTAPSTGSSSRAPPRSPSTTRSSC